MQKTRRRRDRFFIALCVIVPVVAIAMYVINPLHVRSPDPRQRLFGIGVYRVPSASMAPTLQPGRVLLVRAGDAALGDLQRGDVVVFRPPHHPEQVWLKRLIGLPGETVALRAGVLSINGHVIAEPYLDRANTVRDYSLDFGPHRVPPGHVFLLGDNRDNSEDSRFWGDAAETSITARMLR